MSITIIDMLIPKSNKRTRPGIKRKPTSITIHETDNTNVRANARAHALLQYNGNSRQASWNYTVDDEPEVYRSIPDDEVTYHAGTAGGNHNSISIEICVNRDGNFKKAVENAVQLVRYLIKVHPHITINDIYQHNYWSGKNCPRNLRSGAKGINWNDFIEAVRKGGPINVDTPKTPPKYNQTSDKFAIGAKVILKSSAKTYATGQTIPDWAKCKEYTVLQRGSNRVLLKEIMSWVHTSDLEEPGKISPKPSDPAETKNSGDIVHVGTEHKGKRLEAIVDNVNFYDTQRWINPTGSYNKGHGWTIVDLYRVDGSLQYKVKNSNGDIYYTTAREDLVKVVDNKEKEPAKTTTSYSVGDKVKIKTNAKTYYTGETIPSKFKGKTYTIQQVDNKNKRLLIKELYSWVRMSDVTP